MVLDVNSYWIINTGYVIAEYLSKNIKCIQTSDNATQRLKTNAFFLDD